MFGLLGPNGAGKTTTIKMMLGLVLPDTGRVRLNGHDVQGERAPAMRQVGAVLEGSRNVYWTLSAWQNLLYFGRLKGLPTDAIRPRAEYLLRSLGLWERRNEQVGGYSRGMQQKVAVAAALIADPPILLLAELLFGVAFIVGGVFLPLDRLPDWMAVAGTLLFPTTQGIEVLREVLLEGHSLDGLQVDWGLAWLIAQPIGLLAAGALFYRASERIAKRQGTLARY